MKVTTRSDFSIAGFAKMVLITFAISSLMFATKGTAQDSVLSKPSVLNRSLSIDNAEMESYSKGFFMSTPVYLYGNYSSCGLHAGYQFKKIQLRAEVSVVNDYKNGKEIFFAMPTIGFFCSKTWPSNIRTCEGVAIGVETGIKNSFEGEVGFALCKAGIEFRLSERKAFFLEVGTGESFHPKEGAFNTGTVIGGGFKCYLGKDIKCK